MISGKTFLCLIFLLASLAVLAGSPGKKALVIAISDYPEESGWPDISSDNDVILILDALEHEGFQSADIRVLRDSLATRNGMEDAFRKLIAAINKGDIVVIHFSGHGQQIQDDNGDELDGYDEALVPFGAEVYYREGTYTGQNHFRDDLLKGYLDMLRSKAGDKGNVLVILDACHSGTATRGIGKHRGTSVIMQSPDYKPGVHEGVSRGYYESAGENHLAPIVLISASSDHELNFEYTDEQSGKSYGSLSYAFSKVIIGSPENITYRALFDRIKVEMSSIAPKQAPQLEGDIDREIFGGMAVKQEKYFRVTQWTEENIFRIDGGTLMGLNDGAEVGFYPAGTSSPENAKTMSSGRIVHAGLLESDVKPDNPMDQETAENSWVFVRSLSWGNCIVRIWLDFESDLLKAAFKNKLSAYPVIEIVDNGEELLIEEHKDTVIRMSVTASDDLIVFSGEAVPGSQTEEVMEKAVLSIQNFGQSKLIRNLEMTNENYCVEAELIPVSIKKSGTMITEEKRLPLSAKTENGNQVVFYEGDNFRVRLINKGHLTAYFNLLDIQPDNKINFLLPPYLNGRALMTPEECKISPGDTIICPYLYDIAPPFGNEVFKLVAAGEPFDLAPAAAVRGGSVSSYPPSEVNIHTLVFRISRK